MDLNKFPFLGQIFLNPLLVDFKDLHVQKKNYIKMVIDNPKTIIVIKNFLDKKKIYDINLQLKKVPAHLIDIPHPGAKTFPASCSSGNLSSESVNKFFANSSMANQSLERFNFLNDFIQLIKLLNCGCSSKLALNEIQQPYLHGTFRFIEPINASIGLTSPHTGYDYALRNINYSYQALSKYIDVFKQLSLFTMIDNAEQGGDFTLFNYKRSTYPILDGKSVKKSKNERSKKVFYNSNSGFKTIHLNEGDAVLFADYELWHKVEKVEGTQDRITFGTWLGYNMDQTQLYYWS